ncbi:DUF899 family protein [Isoptericola sp. NPDC057559]|uniref:DUF899 family protein n=1 Tax=Isoptericola sp. NPDC057559 TaxID=3346168 RepID=UPI0036A461F8
MPSEPTPASRPAPSPAPGGAPVPAAVDRARWLRERSTLRDREKAHTREGDAIAAARRRLPMTEVDAGAVLVGPHGPTPLLEVFEGRDQLVAYKHMWHAGQPVEGQCEGCTASIWSVQDAAYLHHRGATFAVFCEGPWEEVAPYVAFMGYEVPWYSMQGVTDEAVGGGLSDDRGLISCYLRVGDRVFLTNETTHRGVEAIMAQAQLLDMTVYGRQERWEDSPAGWPQHPTATWWKDRGRPVPQWARPGAAPYDPHAAHGHHH